MHASWNIFFSLFFLLLVSAAFVGLADSGRLVTNLPVFDLVVLSIAAFRLVRLFTYDHITAFLRDELAKHSENTFLGTAGRLLACPWCTGMWFGFLVYVGYAAVPSLMLPLAIILSVAALATVFQISTNAIGWTAEVQKQRAGAANTTGKNTCG